MIPSANSMRKKMMTDDNNSNSSSNELRGFFDEDVALSSGEDSDDDDSRDVLLEFGNKVRNEYNIPNVNNLRNASKLQSRMEEVGRERASRNNHNKTMGCREKYFSKVSTCLFGSSSNNYEEEEDNCFISYNEDDNDDNDELFMDDEEKERQYEEGEDSMIDGLDKKSSSNNNNVLSDLMSQMDDRYHIRLIISAGFAFFSDAIEIVTTLFLAIQVNDTTVQCAYIVSSLFGGMIVGAIIFNVLLVPYVGKRPVFNVTMIVRPILGYLTLLVPRDFRSILILRFLIGMMASGRIAAYQVLNEYNSKKTENGSSNLWIYIQLFWSTGVLYVVFVASMTDWITTIIILEVTIIISSILSIAWFLESPTWLLEQDRTEEALYMIGYRTTSTTVQGHATTTTFSTGNDILDDYLKKHERKRKAPPRLKPLIQSSSSPNIPSFEKYKLRMLWFCFGVLYYGSMYLIHDRYYNNRDYYGTIVVCAEMEMLGIFLGWYGITTIGAKWTQFIGFSLSTYGIFFMAFFMDNTDDPSSNDMFLVLFAAVARLSLMMAITSSMTYAHSELLFDSIAFCMRHMGGMVAPFFIGSSTGVVLSCLLLQIVLLLYFFSC